jgi:hypothetical protein
MVFNCLEFGIFGITRINNSVAQERASVTLILIAKRNMVSGVCESLTSHVWFSF